MFELLLQPLQATGFASGLANGISTFITEVILFLPNLIAALIVLLVGYLIVRGVTHALKWGLDKAHLDSRLSATRIGQAVEKSGSTIGRITVSAVKWILYLIVVVYAITLLNIPPLTASMLGVLAWVPNLVGAAIIVFAGLIIGSYIGRWIEDILPRYGVSGSRIISLVVELLIYLFVFNLAVIQLGIGQGILFVATTALSWGLAAALAIGLGGALLYTLKDVLPAIVSGSTTIGSTLKPGQTVMIEGVGMGDGAQHPSPLVGRVASVGMFNTILERTNGGPGDHGFVILPNNLLVDKPIVVQGGEFPEPFDRQLSERASEVNKRYEQEQARNSQTPSQDTVASPQR
jgi:Conserved TM helix